MTTKTTELVEQLPRQGVFRMKLVGQGETLPVYGMSGIATRRRSVVRQGDRLAVKQYLKYGANHYWLRLELDDGSGGNHFICMRRPFQDTFQAETQLPFNYEVHLPLPVDFGAAASSPPAPSTTGLNVNGEFSAKSQRKRSVLPRSNTAAASATAQRRLLSSSAAASVSSSDVQSAPPQPAYRSVSFEDTDGASSGAAGQPNTVPAGRRNFSGLRSPATYGRELNWSAGTLTSSSSSSGLLPTPLSASSSSSSPSSSSSHSSTSAMSNSARPVSTLSSPMALDFSAAQPSNYFVSHPRALQDWEVLAEEEFAALEQDDFWDAAVPYPSPSLPPVSSAAVEPMVPPSTQQYPTASARFEEEGIRQVSGGMVSFDLDLDLDRPSDRPAALSSLGAVTAGPDASASLPLARLEAQPSAAEAQAEIAAEKTRVLEQLMVQTPPQLGAIRQTLEELPVASVPGPMWVDVSNLFLLERLNSLDKTTGYALRHALQMLGDKNRVTTADLLSSAIPLRLAQLVDQQLLQLEETLNGRPRREKMPRSLKHSIAHVLTRLLADMASAETLAADTVLRTLTAATAVLETRLSTHLVWPLCERVADEFASLDPASRTQLAQRTLRWLVVASGTLFLPEPPVAQPALTRLLQTALAQLPEADLSLSSLATSSDEPINDRQLETLMGAILAQSYLPGQDGLPLVAVRRWFSDAAAVAEIGRLPPAMAVALCWLAGCLSAQAANTQAGAQRVGMGTGLRVRAALFNSAVEVVADAHRRKLHVPRNSLPIILEAAKICECAESVRTGHLPYELRRSALAGDTRQPFLLRSPPIEAAGSQPSANNLRVTAKTMSAATRGRQNLSRVAEEKKELRWAQFLLDRGGDGPTIPTSAAGTSSEEEHDAALTAASSQEAASAARMADEDPMLSPAEAVVDDTALSLKRQKKLQFQLAQGVLRQRMRTSQHLAAGAEEARLLLLDVMDLVSTVGDSRLQSDVRKLVGPVWQQVVSGVSSVEAAAAVDKLHLDGPYGVYEVQPPLQEQLACVQSKVVDVTKQICEMLLRDGPGGEAGRAKAALQISLLHSRFTSAAGRGTAMTNMSANFLSQRAAGHDLRWDLQVDWERLSAMEIRAVSFFNGFCHCCYRWLFALLDFLGSP